MSSPISSNLGPTARSRNRGIPRPASAKPRRVGSTGRRKATTMARMRTLFQSSVLVAILIVVAATRAKADDLNDYPTSARADYVFGCMKANGETQELLQKCSCSIDVIASIIPYDRYVTAETILSMSQVTGPVGSEFRSTETSQGWRCRSFGGHRRKRKFAASDRTRPRHHSRRGTLSGREIGLSKREISGERPERNVEAATASTFRPAIRP